MTGIIQKIRRKWKRRYRCLGCKTEIESNPLWYLLQAGRCPVCGFPLVPVERRRLEDWEEK